MSTPNNYSKKNALASAVLLCSSVLSTQALAATEFSYGGYIKFDAIFSQYSDQQRAGNVGDDFLVPSTIAVGDGSAEGDMVYDSNAKFSRLNFKTVTDTDAGQVMGYIEMDFNAGQDERLTNQASNGLRHAFFKWTHESGSSLLTGQTWSTFFNVGALPEAVDFIGPTSGSIFIRQQQVRYTMPMASGSFMIGAENPSVSLYDDRGTPTANDNAIDDSTLPDLIARFDGKAGDISFSAAAMMRQIRYNDGANDEAENGFAVTFSGKYAMANGNDIKFMLSSGALGRYIALNAFRDGGVEADGAIDLNSVTGGYLAYKHMWSSKVRSTFMYAFAEADNSDSITSDVTKSINNINVNLMYSPAPKLTLGAEYIMAERETESGANGDLSRLQFTSKWAF
ncbi:hypothetical protein HF888_02120 [Bermanella marisrubri]|uniref:Porin n=1 Tax=Bermanella marisrubri TaxID=207949 RepID=Q1N3V4_9GAMM|nr:DcaP family trimeric outer membrane transporter [Bermanella marisrubri]EAT12770.1 hypothetical protein RED65_11894 [Oceanobacter sp. RED65] [Bermanella marisrubri]QIZ83099.1 hypothetical protein HF888_02120 [Bermanella marisrubri]